MKKILLVGSSGYIGSVMTQYLQHTSFDVDTLDHISRPSPSVLPPKICCKYQDMTKEDLAHYDVIIWLAGHSSVFQSKSDPSGCVHNNLFGLIELNENFDGLLVYASSGSVYSNPGFTYSNELSVCADALNVYDYSKIACDNYMALEGKNFIGLRFGTVVGSSPNMRWELLLNKMVFDAIKNGEINLANPHAVRPILHIHDLCKGILRILEGGPSNQFYNLCSINGSMEFYATAVGQYLNSEINMLESSSTYNFMMSTSKFEKDYPPFDFKKDLISILDDIISAVPP